MADNTPLNDSCRTEGAPIAASTNPANKGLRTDGRVRCAPPPAAEAQGVGPRSTNPFFTAERQRRSPLMIS